MQAGCVATPAHPGDTLWVGGDLGASALGRHLLLAGARPGPEALKLPDSLLLEGAELDGALRCVDRHLAPQPQLELGQRLATGSRTAALDLSDGLSIDLARLAKASGVDAELALDRLPIDPDTKALADRLEVDALALALHGGEDYVLLFTLPPGEEPPVGGCRRIGRLVEPEGLAGRLWKRRPEGAESSAEEARREAIPIQGWDHFAPSDR